MPKRQAVLRKTYSAMQNTIGERAANATEENPSLGSEIKVLGVDAENAANA